MSPDLDEERFWAQNRLSHLVYGLPRNAEGLRRLRAAIEVLQGEVPKALQEPAEELLRAMAAGPKRSPGVGP